MPPEARYTNVMFNQSCVEMQYECPVCGNGELDEFTNEALLKVYRCNKCNCDLVTQKRHKKSRLVNLATLIFAFALSLSLYILDYGQQYIGIIWGFVILVFIVTMVLDMKSKPYLEKRTKTEC
jgi:uncharacterized protein (DUF983 family)